MPTVPTHETILRTRVTLEVVLRIIAAALVFWWIVQTLERLLNVYVLDRQTAALIRAGMLPTEPVLQPILLAAVLPACAIALALLAPKIMRRLVPLPRPGCPFCDHGALPESGTNCTECGRSLPEQLLR